MNNFVGWEEDPQKGEYIYDKTLVKEQWQEISKYLTL